VEAIPTAVQQKASDPWDRRLSFLCIAWLRQRKAHLGIQVDVVVPGHPIPCVQDAVGHAHHFSEAGG
jgi:hypothetical protein